MQSMELQRSLAESFPALVCSVAPEDKYITETTHRALYTLLENSATTDRHLYTLL